MWVSRHENVDLDVLEEQLVRLAERVDLVVEAGLIRGEEHALFIRSEIESTGSLATPLVLIPWLSLNVYVVIELVRGGTTAVNLICIVIFHHDES